jgi:hypothetical protein
MHRAENEGREINGHALPYKRKRIRMTEPEMGKD